MKITPDFLQQQWENIAYKDGAYIKLDTPHNLEWYIGYQSISQPTLLIICDNEVTGIESSKSMLVQKRKREIDNRWAITLELLRNEQQDVFCILCCDVIEYSRTAINEEDALKLVINRYRQWSQLLEAQKKGFMSENSQKGLIGELLFLEKRILKSDSELNAVQGWVGADGADQDFMYSDGWYEIKSIGASAITVKISSLEQLNCSDCGELVIFRLDKVSQERLNAFSLNDIINKIYEMLPGEALTLFRSKLMAYGYIDLIEYSENKYICSAIQRYSVNETFPRLTVETVPFQIASLQYDLDIPTLENWKVE